MVALDDFATTASLLRSNPEPEQGFGTIADPGDVERQRRGARATYRRLVQIVHPDRNGGSVEATEAFKLLEALWRRAWQLLDDGTYGADRAPTVRVKTRLGDYVLQGRFAVGEVCDLFYCQSSDTAARPHLFKVARRPRDNDLVNAEARTLRRLQRDLEERWLPFLPPFVDHVNFRAPGGIRRAANVMERLDGWYTLQQVADAYPSGLDARDVAWMWRRLLAILGAVHEAGIVHGAVVPSNVLIHPEKHGLVLADWCYAFDVASGRPVAVSSERWRYPLEIGEKRLTVSSDLYTAATTALTLLLGLGQPVTGNMADRVPKPLRAHFRSYLIEERQRPTSAWAMLGHFENVLERCYGRRQFRPFVMPESV